MANGLATQIFPEGSTFQDTCSRIAKAVARAGTVVTYRHWQARSQQFADLCVKAEMLPPIARHVQTLAMNAACHLLQRIIPHDAVSAWLDDEASARQTYGDISMWDTSEVTNMDSLFCGQSCEYVRKVQCQSIDSR